jgi:hypothetical protein
MIGQSRGEVGKRITWGNSVLFSQPIKTFPPGAQLIFPLAQAFDVFGEEANSEATPRAFNVNATYSFLHKTVTEAITIDLNPYLKSQPEPDPRLDKLDIMAKLLGRWLYQFRR